MAKAVSHKFGEIKNLSTPEFYEENGFALIENAVEEDYLKAYENRWVTENGNNKDFSGWSDHKSYMEIDEIKDVLCSQKINDFFLSIDIGVALHVSRTDWAPRFTGWHIDAVHRHDIGPKNYVGAYVSLDKTAEESGPIQIISRSHKWEMDYKNTFSTVTGMLSQEDIESMRQATNSDIVTLLPERGDAFVWHGRTVHRGAMPSNPAVPRKGIVAHYCNRLVAEDCVENSGGHVSGKKMIKEFINNESGDDDHFFSKWRTGGYYYPDCTITRTWLAHAYPDLADRAQTISWDELQNEIDVTKRGDLRYLAPGYNPDYS
jgi:ectoine hydroxylase-related dioxygenase (phytanoyl-CoA dioxygenase family)